MQQEALEKAGRFLKDDGVVAIPTDTLYGLAADVFSIDALERIYDIKQRDAIALPVLVSTWDQVKRMAKSVPPETQRLVEEFWPGGLTMVVYKANGVPDLLTAGAPTVALRMPDHPGPLALINGLGGPITGTSANISGGEDLKTLADVVEQMGGKVDYVLECGPEPKGTGSTIIDITSGTPKLLRDGVVPFDLVLSVWETAKTEQRRS